MTKPTDKIIDLEVSTDGVYVARNEAPKKVRSATSYATGGAIVKRSKVRQRRTLDKRLPTNPVEALLSSAIRQLKREQTKLIRGIEHETAKLIHSFFRF